MALELGGLIVLVVALLLVDLVFFARGRDPSFREGAIWSVGWLVLSLLVALPVLALEGSTAAVEYTTVYLIERSLSLDNLFVFILLFTFFRVPTRDAARLLFAGVALALVLRGLAILAGIALIERFHFVIYILGVTLLLLAWRILRGVDDLHPEKSLLTRGVQKLVPVDWEAGEGQWTTRRDGRRHITPLVLALVAVVSADIAFAVDSIPAAFGITRDEFVIWTGNAFALLGLRALFVLVEGLRDRFRYLDQTIALLLAIVGVKLLIEDIIKIGPLASLAIVGFVLAAGILLSLRADRRDEAQADEQAGEAGERPRDPQPSSRS